MSTPVIYASLRPKLLRYSIWIIAQLPSYLTPRMDNGFIRWELYLMHVVSFEYGGPDKILPLQNVKGRCCLCLVSYILQSPSFADMWWNSKLWRKWWELSAVKMFNISFSMKGRNSRCFWREELGLYLILNLRSCHTDHIFLMTTCDIGKTVRILGKVPYFGNTF